MGTRADFYIGTGKEAEWLGSVAWDGYEWEEEKNCPLMSALTPDEFREAVEEIKSERDDFTSPEDGWPWPWDDSSTTDYQYAFVDGQTRINPSNDWPNMKDRKNVQWGKKSGIIVIG